MKRKIIIIFLLFLILMGIFYLINSKKDLTGKAILSKYTYTKAICNETNYCQDYEIICEGNKTLNMIPITGSAVQFPKNWRDSRDEDIKNKLCE